MTQGGTVPNLTATISGFVGGDILANSGVTGSAGLSTSGTSSSPAGPYAITTAIGTLAASNYNFGTFNNGTLTVNPSGNGNNSGAGGGVLLPPSRYTTTISASPPTAVAPIPSSPAAASSAVLGVPVPNTVQAVAATTGVYDTNTANNQAAQQVIPGGRYTQTATYITNPNDAPNVALPSFTSLASANGAVTLSHPVRTTSPLYDPMYDNPDLETPVNIPAIQVHFPGTSTVKSHTANDNAVATISDDQDNTATMSYDSANDSELANRPD